MVAPGPERVHGEWLDLVADLLDRPWTSWPADRVTPELVRTFGAPAGSYFGQEPGRTIVQRQWPGDFHADRRHDVERWTLERAPRDHPLLRYYLGSGRADVMQVADVPERFAGPRVHARWRAACDDVLGGTIVSQAAVPVRLAPGTNRTFLVGRIDPFTAQEIDLLRRLQRVFVALDRQVTAHARWSARTGGHAIPAAADVGLTPRESAVLDLLASGATARAIARRLAVGERTVQKHLQRVYAKLGVADRLAAVQRAQLVGLLPPPGPGRP